MPCGMWDLSWPGMGNYDLCTGSAESLTIGPPGNLSLIYFFKFVIHCHTLIYVITYFDVWQEEASHYT